MVMVEKVIMRSACAEETASAATQRPAELEDVHKYKTQQSATGRKDFKADQLSSPRSTQLWKLHQTKLYF